MRAGARRSGEAASRSRGVGVSTRAGACRPLRSRDCCTAASGGIVIRTSIDACRCSRTAGVFLAERLFFYTRIQLASAPSRRCTQRPAAYVR
ncbi:hypothetical protein WS71_17790 [Burkholderia mayonis]|uniref:Uncharacterized protein n=1 Tax=Burkholderia mayonis TaxID=1385591 RepID=A0A1B4FZX7_9BURK|nr:hypothetical protein WS71_17790 [Burkholderia mayonis]